MAKSKPALVRHIQGFMPSTKCWTDVKVYSDHSIEINRLFCDLDPRKDWGIISETDWFPHRHFMALLSSAAWKDITCINES